MVFLFPSFFVFLFKSRALRRPVIVGKIKFSNISDIYYSLKAGKKDEEGELSGE